MPFVARKDSRRRRLTPGGVIVTIKQKEQPMAPDKTDLITAGNIAKALKVSDAKVKKAIQDLGIKPAAKKGICNLYSADAVAKVKAALK
jgi:hypothetical protein